MSGFAARDAGRFTARRARRALVNGGRQDPAAGAAHGGRTAQDGDWPLWRHPPGNRRQGPKIQGLTYKRLKALSVGAALMRGGSESKRRWADDLPAMAATHLLNLGLAEGRRLPHPLLEQLSGAGRRVKEKDAAGFSAGVL